MRPPTPSIKVRLLNVAQRSSKIPFVSEELKINYIFNDRVRGPQFVKTALRCKSFQGFNASKLKNANQTKLVPAEFGFRGTELWAEKSSCTRISQQALSQPTHKDPHSLPFSAVGGCCCRFPDAYITKTGTMHLRRIITWLHTLEHKLVPLQ